MRPGDDPAYVSFDSSTGLPTLNIDKETWDDANLGDPYARYVVAHEIGHLIFHDHDAKAFSNDPREQIVFELMNEFSAEWQANIFAGYFLLPTHIVASFDDVQRLTESCGVTRQFHGHPERNNSVANMFASFSIARSMPLTSAAILFR